MISVDLVQFFTALLIILTVGAGLSVAWHRHVENRGARAVRRERISCRICGCSYRRSGSEAIQNCPACGKPNRVGRDRRLG